MTPPRPSRSRPTSIPGSGSFKIRRKARTLEDVVEQALDALEEQEANDG